jgi:hypothetical protein
MREEADAKKSAAAVEEVKNLSRDQSKFCSVEPD